MNAFAALFAAACVVLTADNTEIVVGKGAPKTVRFAAEELRTFLSQVFASDVPQVQEESPGKVQIYLPDLKYADASLAAEYSAAPDYFEVATAAIVEMHRQVGDYVLEDGLLKSGVVIRHLVLPGQLENTRRVLDWISRTFAPGQVLVSLMSQYTPQPHAEGLLSRRVTAAEYRAAAQYMENCGITDGFLQERTAAKEEYTPPFDLTGV